MGRFEKLGRFETLKTFETKLSALKLLKRFETKCRRLKLNEEDSISPSYGYLGARSLKLVFSFSAILTVYQVGQFTFGLCTTEKVLQKPYFGPSDGRSWFNRVNGTSICMINTRPRVCVFLNVIMRRKRFVWGDCSRKRSTVRL